MRMCVINENKHLFQEFRSIINCILLVFVSDFNNLYHVGLFAYVFMCK